MKSLQPGDVIELRISGRGVQHTNMWGGRMVKITGLTTHDLRFPSPDGLDGSDAMNPNPVYSAAYLVLETDGSHQGHGLTFTIGRGNEICVAAIEALRPLVVGLDLDWVRDDMARFWRHVTDDSQLRWIGPDKGAIHMATGAVVNAMWDLLAKETGNPFGNWWGTCRPRKSYAWSIFAI